jgi:hypothetical protein
VSDNIDNTCRALSCMRRINRAKLYQSINEFLRRTNLDIE